MNWVLNPGSKHLQRIKTCFLSQCFTMSSVVLQVWTVLFISHERFLYTSHWFEVGRAQLENKLCYILYVFPCTNWDSATLQPRFDNSCWVVCSCLETAVSLIWSNHTHNVLMMQISYSKCMTDKPLKMFFWNFWSAFNHDYFVIEKYFRLRYRCLAASCRQRWP